MFDLHCVCATFVNKRVNNEDNYFVLSEFAKMIHGNEMQQKFATDDKHCLFGVFDGLGGEENGELASYTAAEMMNGREELGNYYIEANKKICSARKSSKMMGSTAVVLDIYDGTYSCSNIGDSRAYLIRNKKTIQLSEDHTSLAKMIKMGAITREQAEKSKYKNVLSQCLGIDEEDMEISPYYGDSAEINDKDIFLLCSDGLTGKLTDEEICSIVLCEEKADVCNVLFERAKNSGAKDNVTILIVYATRKNKAYNPVETMKKITGILSDFKRK
jgi:protein phosphatase